METFDQFSQALLEEAKHFLEKARQEKDTSAINAYLHASLLLSISSLEAYVNGIADDFKDQECLNIMEKGFLLEQEVSFKNGEFILKDNLRMSRLIERIEFLFSKFKPKKVDKNAKWWQDLNEGIKLRNKLMHPKEYNTLDVKQIETTLRSVIQCIDKLFQHVYKQKLPTHKLDLNSKLTF